MSPSSDVMLLPEGESARKTFFFNYWRQHQSVWITADGERIPIRELTDLHLSNAIEFLRREMLKDTVPWLILDDLLFERERRHMEEP